MSDFLLELLPFYLFLMGLLLGSFANVIIYRWPQGKSVVAPRSSCPKCHKKISWYDNVPVLSWLWLRGRCRSCREIISWRYPLVEILMATLFLAVYYHVGAQWILLEYLWLVFGLVTVSFIDFDHYLLPDRFTLSGIVVGLLGALINPEREFLDAFLGVLLGGGFLWAIAYFYYVFRKEEGMGGGDIKLLAWIGAVLGWKAIPFVILSSSIIGSIIGLLWSLKKQDKGLKTVIPFGPYLALGALLHILGGQSLADWYLGLFFPSLN